MAIKLGDEEFKVMIASAGFGYALGWWWQRARIKLVSLLGQKIIKTLGLNYLLKFSETIKHVLIVTKTITCWSEEGNYHWWAPWRTIRFWENGMLNAVGLTNKGIRWWIKKCYPKIEKLGYQVILSIAFRNLKELSKIIDIIWACDRLKGIELNVSCPNINYWLSKEEIVRACQMIKERTTFPLILKISHFNYYKDKLFWEELKGLVAAISINAVPWSMIYGNKKSPFEKYKYGSGAVSGKNAQSYTWALHRYLQDITDIPVILPSLWHLKDLKEAFLERKAPAISMCALFLKHPIRAIAIIKKCLKQKT